jgi:hypothetical protein
VIVSVDDADTVTEDTVLLPGTTPNVPDTEPLLSSNNVVIFTTKGSECSI